MLSRVAHMYVGRFFKSLRLKQVALAPILQYSVSFYCSSQMEVYDHILVYIDKQYATVIIILKYRFNVTKMLQDKTCLVTTLSNSISLGP